MLSFSFFSFNLSILNRNYLEYMTGAHVAQLAEHFLGKGEVTGSSPVAGSRTNKKLSDLDKKN
jgi:hypothetical protein